MATLDASIVIISMPAIFRGIHLDPLRAANITYLLWMVLGYLLVSAIFVVPMGRLGDIYGRVRIYNMGFALFTVASLALSLDPFVGAAGAWWLIIGRMIQALGGSVLMSNSAAILTDAFPFSQRGMALGMNQIAGLSGQFLGLLAGGLLVTIDWRAVFWVNVPIGIVGTIWSYRSLHEVGTRTRTPIDWLGTFSFTAGMALVLVAITSGIQPYHHNPTGWSNPLVLGELVAGLAILVLFCVIELRVPAPMVRLGLFRIRAFAAGNIAAFMVSLARGGLQFMLIIWLQGIWLPLHGYSFAQTPLWASIYLLPLTVGFLIAGPLCGHLGDIYGVRPFATTGLVIVAASFVGLLVMPVNFNYWVFGAIIFISGIGQGMFSAPNTSAIMSSVPPSERGAASGMRSTFQNSGTALSIGIFFSLMTTGLAQSLPGHVARGLVNYGVPASIAHTASQLPPVSTLFAAFLGANPISNLLAPSGILMHLSPHAVATLTGTLFFPNLIAQSFHDGLAVVFASAAIMALIGAVASAMRGSHATSAQIHRSDDT